jgi:hypothetical protein
MVKNHKLPYQIIDNNFIILKPIFISFSNKKIIELLDEYRKNYFNLKLIYFERGEPITGVYLDTLKLISDYFDSYNLFKKNVLIYSDDTSNEYINYIISFGFNYFYYPFHLTFATPKEFFKQENLNLNNIILKKHFLSLNRMQKLNRDYLYSFIKENNLFDKFYYSFRYLNDFNIDENYNEQTYAQSHNSILKYYLNSFLQIVCETKFEKEKEIYIESVFISEKTFRALAFPRPFIIVGQKGLLKSLKKLGFKTFENIFDESYDNIENNEERFNKIKNIILDISKKSINELKEILISCEEIFIHNQKQILFLENEYFKDISEIIKK